MTYKLTRITAGYDDHKLRTDSIEGRLVGSFPHTGIGVIIENDEPIVTENGEDIRRVSTSPIREFLPKESGPFHWMFITQTGTKYKLEEIGNAGSNQ